jgi:transcriptional regulator with XRE-family HTH domain
MSRQEFAGLLKKFRQREHLTQDAAAALLGISLRTWQNWEVARNMPRGFGLHALLLALRSSPPKAGSPAAPRTKPPGIRKKRRPPAPPEKETPQETTGAPSSLAAHLL